MNTWRQTIEIFLEYLVHQNLDVNLPFLVSFSRLMSISFDRLMYYYVLTASMREGL